jgi:hypothetical protein
LAEFEGVIITLGVIFYCYGVPTDLDQTLYDPEEDIPYRDNHCRHKLNMPNDHYWVFALVAAMGIGVPNPGQLFERPSYIQGARKFSHVGSHQRVRRQVNNNNHTHYWQKLCLDNVIDRIDNRCPQWHQTWDNHH